MNKVWQEMVNLLTSGESFVVATVFDKSGSAPRPSGAKMIIKGDGSIVGTIGGGRLEGEIRELVQDVFKTKSPHIRFLNLTGADAAQMEMICGGTVNVLVDYIDALDQGNLEIYRNIVDVITKREKAWLITVLGTKDYNKNKRQQCLIRENGTLIGRLECDGEFLSKLLAGPAKMSIIRKLLKINAFLLNQYITGTVYIFGAGHVSQQIAPLAERVGLRRWCWMIGRNMLIRNVFPVQNILLESMEIPAPTGY